MRKEHRLEYGGLTGQENPAKSDIGISHELKGQSIL